MLHPMDLMGKEMMEMVDSNIRPSAYRGELGAEPQNYQNHLV